MWGSRDGVDHAARPVAGQRWQRQKRCQPQQRHVPCQHLHQFATRRRQGHSILECLCPPRSCSRCTGGALDLHSSVCHTRFSCCPLSVTRCESNDDCPNLERIRKSRLGRGRWQATDATSYSSASSFEALRSVQLLPLAASSRARGCCSFHKQCVKHVVVDDMAEVSAATARRCRTPRQCPHCTCVARAGRHRRARFPAPRGDEHWVQRGGTHAPP